MRGEMGWQRPPRSRVGEEGRCGEQNLTMMGGFCDKGLSHLLTNSSYGFGPVIKSPNTRLSPSGQLLPAIGRTARANLSNAAPLTRGWGRGSACTRAAREVRGPERGSWLGPRVLLAITSLGKLHLQTGLLSLHSSNVLLLYFLCWAEIGF